MNPKNASPSTSTLGPNLLASRRAAVDFQPIYDVHVLSTLNSLRVPVEFLEADTVYELEVLALEVSGNQTITVAFFKTL